jgi:hypothetical protein
MIAHNNEEDVTMSRQSRSNLAAGIILILIGAWFLLVRLAPGLAARINVWISWPWFVIGAGLLILIIGLLIGVPGMAVPAAVVGGIGGILYYQNATGNWESWAYVWTLIPGFVGVGTLVMGVLGENPRQSFRAGINLILGSLVGFAIFGSFLGGWDLLGPYWPVLIILLGVWLLFNSFLRMRR